MVQELREVLNMWDRSPLGNQVGHLHSPALPSIPVVQSYAQLCSRSLAESLFPVDPQFQKTMQVFSHSLPSSLSFSVSAANFPIELLSPWKPTCHEDERIGQVAFPVLSALQFQFHDLIQAFSRGPAGACLLSLPLLSVDYKHPPDRHTFPLCCGPSQPPR